MNKKITAFFAAAYIASALSLGALAAPPADTTGDNVIENAGEGVGSVLDGIGEGVSDVANGIGNAAGDVLDGAGNAVEDITGAGDTTGSDTVVNDADPTDPVDTDEITVVTDDDDVEDAAEIEDVDDDGDYEITKVQLNKNESNPATGSMTFVTASAIAVTAAFVAYLTKRRSV